MLSAKDELAHVVAGMTEEEAEIALDFVGNARKDADKTQSAIELLKAAARLLYKDGNPASVQAGEQVDAILKVLISATAEKKLHERLATILRSFASSLVNLVRKNESE